MNQVAQRIRKINQRGNGAFIPYIMAGDPNPKKCLQYIQALEAGGADVIELGVPFSDPVADGPTIQTAGVRALESTDSLDRVFELVREAREVIRVPLILMSYYNPILQFGEEDFLENCRSAGADGVIIPDLPPDEASGFFASAENRSIETPLLATPDTDEGRLKEIAEKTSGFLYLVSRPGTTGVKTKVGKTTKRAIKSARSGVPDRLPVCVGFGLSSPDQIRQVIGAGADGAIVGSAIVKRIGDGDRPEQIEKFVANLKDGTRV